MSQLKINEKIKLNILGKIVRGENIGSFIKIKYDPNDTGGYYIFQSTSKKFDSPETFDAWVENIDELNKFFLDSNWFIEWND